MKLVIRFTNSNSSTDQVPDLSIPISSFDNVHVSWLKSTIREKVPQSSNKRLRLIYNGRVLNEKTELKEVVKPNQAFVHCVIGEELSASQLAQESSLDKPQEVSTTEIIGFDRLLQQGFSQEDVSDLRRQFNLMYGESEPRADIDDIEENEQRQRELRQLEERWIESTNNNEVVEEVQPIQQLEDESHVNEDLLLGFCIGVFLGVVAIVFLLADETVFNKRQKMSIIAGLFINFSLAIIRGQWI